LFPNWKNSNIGQISARNLTILVVVPTIALISVILFIDATISSSMKIRDLVMSEHVDDGQKIDSSVAQSGTTTLVVKSYWNKNRVSVVLFTNDLDPAKSKAILQNVTNELAYINEQAGGHNQTGYTANKTDATASPLIYGSWLAVLQTLQNNHDVRMPILEVISENASRQNADIKVYFEGKPHPEGRGLGLTTVMSDSQTLEIVSAEIHIYQSYQSYQEGILGAVLRHELGHALGLGHSTDITSIMYKRVVIKNDKVIGVIGQCESEAIETAYVENKIRDIPCKASVTG